MIHLLIFAILVAILCIYLSLHCWFQEAVKKPHPIIRLLRPLPAPLSPVQNQDFGVLLVWKETFLVTFNKHSLLVLDPQQATVVTSLSNIRDLHSVSVINSEIFIIEGMRNIVRIAYVPDKFNGMFLK